MPLDQPPLSATRLVPGAGFTPPASPWLTDTVNGVDIYAKGFVQRPTIFFDPGVSATSRNLGTFRNPYTTAAQVQARVAGSMAGQVLGIKRGSLYRGGLAFTCYGSSGSPFFIVPYGDNQALPVVSGGAVRTDWSVYGSDARLWLGATTYSTAVDVFEVVGGVYDRLWAVSSIANLQAYISAPVAGTVGAFCNVANTIYIYLQDGSNPNGGQIETASASNALVVSYSDVSGTGNIVVSGIAAMMSRDSAIQIKAANSSGANAPANIQVVGCQASQAGVQYGASLGADGIIIYGIADAVRLTGGYVAGNYSYQNLNNAYEFAATDGLVCERNLGYANGGNAVAELWALNSNSIIRWNRGYGDPAIRTSTRTNSGSNTYHDSGIWLTGYNSIAGGTLDNTKSTGNAYYGNHIQDYGVWGIDEGGGQNTTAFNNSIVTKSVAGTSVGFRFAGGTTASGRNFYNNLVVASAGEAFKTFTRIYKTGADATTPTPTMDYNHYYNLSTPGSSGGDWEIDGAASFTMAAWRTATSQEAHSASTLGTAPTTAFTFGNLLDGNGNSWLAANTDYALGGSSSARAAGTSISSTAMVNDLDGRAIIAPTTPNVGSSQA